jgi:hypothetical protein
MSNIDKQVRDGPEMANPSASALDFFTGNRTDEMASSVSCGTSRAGAKPGQASAILLPMCIASLPVSGNLTQVDSAVSPPEPARHRSHFALRRHARFAVLGGI